MDKITKNVVLIRTLEAKILLVRTFSFTRLLLLDVAFSIYLWNIWTPNWEWTVNEFWDQTGNVADNLNGVIIF